MNKILHYVFWIFILIGLLMLSGCSSKISGPQIRGCQMLCSRGGGEVAYMMVEGNGIACMTPVMVPASLPERSPVKQRSIVSADSVVCSCTNFATYTLGCDGNPKE